MNAARAGASALRKIGEELWGCDFPFRIFKIYLGRRMTVVRLNQGELILISPGPIDAGLRSSLNAIGRVGYIVAPSRFHDTFVPEALAAFPEAEFFAAPDFEKTLKTQRPQNDLTGVLPASWGDAVEVQLIGGMPRVNECVIFHRPSSTLIVADLVFNMPRKIDVWSALFYRLNGALGRSSPTRLFRAMIRDKTAFRRSIERVLQWDFDRLVPCHGQIINSDGRPVLARAFL